MGCWSLVAEEGGAQGAQRMFPQSPRVSAPSKKWCSRIRDCSSDLASHWKRLSSESRDHACDDSNKKWCTRISYCSSVLASHWKTFNRIERSRRRCRPPGGPSRSSSPGWNEPGSVLPAATENAAASSALSRITSSTFRGA